MDQHNIGLAFLAMMVVALPLPIVQSVGYPTYAEQFPTRVRYTGMAFSFNIGAIVGGGVTPYVATALIGQTGNLLMPGFLLMGGALVALIALVAYLLLWPIPITPVSLPVTVQPGYTGVHAVNTKLANLQIIDLKGEVGPEHIAFGPDGKLYTTVVSGNILRMNADGSGQEVFANTGGRVLGFDFDAQGNLIAADSFKGLLSIAPDRKVTVLTDAVNGDEIALASDAAITPRRYQKMSRFAP
jgi:hypothetical protein